MALARGTCKFLDCEEAARVRIVILYSYPHEGRKHTKRAFWLCMVHAELFRSIVDMQILGAGLDEAPGFDDGS